jgi:hypothetical protein
MAIKDPKIGLLGIENKSSIQLNEKHLSGFGYRSLIVYPTMVCLISQSLAVSGR